VGFVALKKKLVFDGVEAQAGDGRTAAGGRYFGSIAKDIQWACQGGRCGGFGGREISNMRYN
jgi:hypothetical protein